MKLPIHNQYVSPFSQRYGSPEMRHIFSEENKYRLWRRIWVALAQVQHKAGLMTSRELADLKKNQNDIDIERICEIEKATRHDVVAAIREFAEKARVGGGKIHLGATSMDIVDNADLIKIKEGMTLVQKRLVSVLTILGTYIHTYADTPCIGYTHLQPAEPTTVGYRLSFYAQDLLEDLEFLGFCERHLKGKGFKGAVGTSASYSSVLQGSAMSPRDMETRVMKLLGIVPADVTSQVYSRKVDYFVLSALSSISSSLSKFAADLRILQSPSIGEWSEPFGKKQVGSSAMPFKKNPITSENICSLGRYVQSFPEVALQNANLSHLERTLDDSANRRLIIPETFLAVDQMLISTEKILQGLVINTTRISFNLHQYAPFAATEAILIAAVKKGGDRQKLHETLRTIAMNAWEQVQKGAQNPMVELLTQDAVIGKYLSIHEIKKCLAVETHIGDAVSRAVTIVRKIKQLKK